MRCAVLGDPIEHSLSPVLHRAGYAAAGLAWEYDACRVPSGGLRAFLGGLGDDWRGLSLTMPLEARGARPPRRPAGVGDGDGLAFGGGQHADPRRGRRARRQHRRARARSPRSASGTCADSAARRSSAVGRRRPRSAWPLRASASATSRSWCARPSGRARPPTGSAPPVCGCAWATWRPTRARRPGRLDDPGVGPDRRPGRPLRRRPRRLRGRLRPVAQPAGRSRRGGRAGARLRPRPAGAPGGAAVRGVHRDVRAAGGDACGRGARAGGVGRADGVRRRRRWSPRCSAAPPASGVPALVARIPEPDEPADDKEPYAAIAARPGLAWKAALASLVAGGLIGAELGWAWPLVYLLPLVPVGVALAVVDWRTLLLPTKVIRPTYALVVVGVLVCWLATRDTDDLVRAGWGFVVVVRAVLADVADLLARAWGTATSGSAACSASPWASSAGVS